QVPGNALGIATDNIPLTFENFQNISNYSSGGFNPLYLGQRNACVLCQKSEALDRRLRKTFEFVGDISLGLWQSSTRIVLPPLANLIRGAIRNFSLRNTNGVFGRLSRELQLIQFLGPFWWCDAILKAIPQNCGSLTRCYLVSQFFWCWEGAIK